MKVPEQLMKLGERWGLLTRRRRELVKQEKNCGNNNKQWLVGVHSHVVRENRPTVAVPVMTPSEVYFVSRSVYHVLQRGGYGLTTVVFSWNSAKLVTPNRR